jgi:hypothetical protein
MSKARLPRRLKKDARRWLAGGHSTLRLRRWALRASAALRRYEEREASR